MYLFRECSSSVSYGEFFLQLSGLLFGFSSIQGEFFKDLFFYLTCHHVLSFHKLLLVINDVFPYIVFLFQSKKKIERKVFLLFQVGLLLYNGRSYPFITLNSLMNFQQVTYCIFECFFPKKVYSKVFLLCIYLLFKCKVNMKCVSNIFTEHTLRKL